MPRKRYFCSLVCLSCMQWICKLSHTVTLPNAFAQKTIQDRKDCAFNIKSWAVRCSLFLLISPQSEMWKSNVCWHWIKKWGRIFGFSPSVFDLDGRITNWNLERWNLSCKCPADNIFTSFSGICFSLRFAQHSSSLPLECEQHLSRKYISQPRLHIFLSFVWNSYFNF